MYGWIGKDPDDLRDHAIVVQVGDIERLILTWERTRNRPPSDEELRGLIDEHVREEVYYREALAMGLDRDDLIVRRRLRQKMEFLSEALADFREPTEAEIETYRTEEPDAFRLPDRYTLEHVFVREGDDRDAALARAKELLNAFGSEEASSESSVLGDHTALPSEFSNVTERDLELQLGPKFVAELAELSTGEWVGPVDSSYGIHLVHIREKSLGRLPELEEIREDVKRGWLSERRRETTERFYQALRERYTVSTKRCRESCPRVHIGRFRVLFRIASGCPRSTPRLSRDCREERRSLRYSVESPRTSRASALPEAHVSVRNQSHRPGDNPQSRRFIRGSLDREDRGRSRREYAGNLRVIRHTYRRPCAGSIPRRA